MEINIPFEVIHFDQSYSKKEGLEVELVKENVIVHITQQFPTPGYSMNVEKVIEKDGECRIYLSIIPPRSDAILPQVITYKTITIELEMKPNMNIKYFVN